MTESFASKEFVRQLLKAHDKFDQKKTLLGHLFAVQDVRAITKLHTWYPGQRAEFDFTKYGVFLYPNSNWNQPELYFDGLGVDHTSGVIGSFVTTTSPTSRDIVSLSEILCVRHSMSTRSMNATQDQTHRFGGPGGTAAISHPGRAA